MSGQQNGGLGGALLGTSSAIGALETAVGVRATNVNASDTIGGKETEAFFKAELGGISVATQANPTARGSITRGQAQETFVAISNGDGVFPLASTADQKAPLGGSDGSFEKKTVATKDGEKELLVNRSGLILMAIPLDATGGLPAGGITLGNLQAAEIKPEFKNSAGAGTTKSTINAVLPGNITVPTFAADPVKGLKSFIQKVYGSRGIEHQLTFDFKKIDANTWTLDIKMDGGASITTKSLVFDANGKMTTIAHVLPLPAVGPAAAAPFSLNLDMSATGEANPQVVSFDLTSMTIQGGDSEDIRVLSKPQEGGKLAGVMNGVAIKDGFIVTKYSNGDEIKRYQVVGLRLNDPTKAVAGNGNSYKIDDCGITVHAFGSNGIGTLESKALENASGSKTTNIIYISKDSSSLMMEYGVLRKLMQNLKGLQDVL